MCCHIRAHRGIVRVRTTPLTGEKDCDRDGKRPPTVTRVRTGPVFSVGGYSFTWSDVIDAARIRGELAGLQQRLLRLGAREEALAAAGALPRAGGAVNRDYQSPPARRFSHCASLAHPWIRRAFRAALQPDRDCVPL